MIVVIKEEYAVGSNRLVQRQELFFPDSYGEIPALEWAEKCRPLPKSQTEIVPAVFKVWTERRDD